MTLRSELDFDDEGDAAGGKAGEDGDEDGEYFQLFYLDMSSAYESSGVTGSDTDDDKPPETGTADQGSIFTYICYHMRALVRYI